MRDAEYTAGLVVVADFDGDTYPDVLSGRHISYNKPAAGTQGHAGTHPGQRGIYDQLPKEWWTFGVTPSAVEAFDADGDGDVDLVIMPRGFDETPPSCRTTRRRGPALVQLLLNDGSGDFSRAERRVIADASFSWPALTDDNDNLRWRVDRQALPTKIVAGQLNTVDDARDDFVVIWPSGGASVFASDSGSSGDIEAGHIFEFAGLRTTAQLVGPRSSTLPSRRSRASPPPTRPSGRSRTCCSWTTPTTCT